MQDREEGPDGLHGRSSGFVLQYEVLDQGRLKENAEVEKRKRRSRKNERQHREEEKGEVLLLLLLFPPCRTATNCSD